MSKKPVHDPFKSKHGFKRFLFMVWKHVNLPDPTPVQYDMADYLQHGPKRCIIEAFRGVGKSWITSAYVVWRLYNDPQLKFLVVSASSERATAFSVFTKRLIAEMEILHHLLPNSSQRDSVIAFDVGPARVDHSPSVKSVGITGQLTGSRADYIIADDIEVANNSATQVMRDKLSEQVKEFDAILKPLDSSRIIYLGTPQTEMSLYNSLPERGYQMRVWPAIYPTQKAALSYNGTLAPFITDNMDGLEGQPTDPRRFDAADLAERKTSYGKAGFALQFMLDTSMSDANKFPLKLEDLIVANLNTKEAARKYVWGPTPASVVTDLNAVGLTGDKYYYPMSIDSTTQEYQGSVMAIDPSGRGKDETGYAVVKQLHGQLFVLEAGGLNGGYSPESLLWLANCAKRHSVNKIITESNFGDGMFTELLKPILRDVHRCSIEEVRHNQQKEVRIIDTLEPVMMQHRLVVDRRVIQKDLETAQDVKRSLFYQMTRLTAERGTLAHDDRLDALSIAVAFWVESMAKHQDRSVALHNEKLLKDELKRFMKNQFIKHKGPKPHGKSRKWA